MAVSDDFNRANGGLGANWTAMINTFTIDTNRVSATTGANTLARWAADSFNNAHSAQIDFTGTAYGGPAVRLTGSGGTACGYVFVPSTGASVLYRVDNGTFTNIGFFDVISAACTVKLDATGSTLTVFKDGVQLNSPVTDATYATGSAGMYGYQGNISEVEIDNFAATGESGGGGGGSGTADTVDRHVRGVGRGVGRGVFHSPVAYSAQDGLWLPSEYLKRAA